MESVSISWLVASAISPLVTVLALWTIYVFHTYRRRWRTVDLFLLTLTSTELLSSVLTFCFAILNLLQRGPALPCLLVRWGQVSTRTLQIAVLASMVVDRALTVRWPYRYRFSVRRNQIRYHIAVLALVAALVGVAAVFAEVKSERLSGNHPKPVDVFDADSWLSPEDLKSMDASSDRSSMLREDVKPIEDSDEKSSRSTDDAKPIDASNGNPSRLTDDTKVIDVPKPRLLPDFESGRCHLHPSQWDIRYSVFLLSLYLGLLILWLFCAVQVEVHRGRPHIKLAPECVSPDLPGMNSPLDTQSSAGSTRALHRPTRQASRRPYGRDGKGTSDLRWPSVAFASLMCFLINHVPYLVSHFYISFLLMSRFVVVDFSLDFISLLKYLKGFVCYRVCSFVVLPFI